MPLPFENRYKKSQVKTDKDCWTCRKTTTTCLLTDNYTSGGDFLYTCEAHLKDRNFATPIADASTSSSSPSGPAPPAKSGLSQADIDAAIKEYKERQKSKGEKDKEGKDKEGKDSDNSESKDQQKGASSKTKDASLSVPQPASPPPPAEPTHYQLHKSFFDMRLRLQQQKKQQREAQTRRSQLVFPTAPSDKPGAAPP